MQHGTCGASALAYGYFASSLGPVFHRYRDACRFAKLAGDLVEKYGFVASQGRVHFFMARVAYWTQPLATAIDLMRASLRGAIDTGDLLFACYSMSNCAAVLLLRNDPLDAVCRETEMALEFARKAKYREVQDIIRSQQRFIATMQGSTATFSTFSDAHFDEATFEAQMTGDRMFPVICSYWTLKLKARFLSGDYAQALAAADKVEPFLSAAAGQIQQLDFYYYAALTITALYENASAGEQAGWRDLLAAHREQLREWAENYPPTFADKHAWCLPRSPASKAAASTRCTCTTKRFGRLTRTALSRTKRWPTRSPRGSIWRAASKQLRTSIYATRVTATTAGAHSAK
jgi:hypothetical protein